MKRQKRGWIRWAAIGQPDKSLPVTRFVVGLPDCRYTHSGACWKAKAKAAAETQRQRLFRPDRRNEGASCEGPATHGQAPQVIQPAPGLRCWCASFAQIAGTRAAALAMLTNQANNEERLWQYRESRLRVGEARAKAQPSRPRLERERQPQGCLGARAYAAACAGIEVLVWVSALWRSTYTSVGLYLAASASSITP